MRQIIRRIGTGLWITLAVIGGGVVALAGLTQLDPRPSPVQGLLITFAQFQPLYASKQVLVVDVRDAGSFAAGRIAGAIHVPLGEIRSRAEGLRRLATGRPVVTYCSCPSEGTSLAAASRLMTAGITAHALIGGFPRWVEFGGAVERDAVGRD